MAKGDGEWWIYDEVAAGDPAARRREEITADRRRIRDPKWWIGGLVATVVVGVGYEAVAAALGDGRFTPWSSLELALIAVVAWVVVTLASALRRP